MTLTSDLHRHWPAIVKAVREGLTRSADPTPAIRRSPRSPRPNDLGNGAFPSYAGLRPLDPASGLARYEHVVTLPAAMLDAETLCGAFVTDEAAFVARWPLRLAVALSTRRHNCWFADVTLPSEQVCVQLFPGAPVRLCSRADATAQERVRRTHDTFKFDFRTGLPTGDSSQARRTCVPLALFSDRARPVMYSVGPWALDWRSAATGGVDLVLSERVLVRPDLDRKLTTVCGYG